MTNGNRTPSFARTLVGCATLLLAAACGPEPVQPKKPVVISSFAATPDRLPAGDAVTLSWKIAGDVATVELLQGTETLHEAITSEGSFTVDDLEAGATRFVLVATGQGGDSRRAEATAIVVDAPTIASFTASRTEAPAGSAVFLSWTTLLADEVKLFEGSTALGTFTGAQAESGSFAVRPEANTEYRLEAKGLAGTDVAAVAVVVTLAPAITSSVVEPASVLKGESVTVRWTTTRATSLTIKEGARTLVTVDEAELAEGSRTFTVDASRTFTLVAAGPGGTDSVELPVEVISAPRVDTFVAAPPDVVAGSEVTLSWSVADANELSLLANGEPVVLENVGLPSGSISLTPGTPTLYELVVTGPGGAASSDLFVTVHGVPVIELFDATPRDTFRRRDPTVLSWRTTGAVAVSVSTSSGEVVDVRDAPAAEGSTQVFPDTDTTYVLTAIGPGGEVESEPVLVTVSEPPPLVELALLRNPINRGMSSEVSWRIVDADSFTLEQSVLGGDFETIDTAGRDFDDALATTPAATTTYRLIATSAAGTTEKTLTQTVVNPPAVTRFETSGIADAESPAIVHVTMDEPFTVTWETTDADGVLFDPPSAAVSDDAPFVTIVGREGTVDLPVPTSDSGYLDVEFPDNFRFPFFNTNHALTRMAAPGFLCFGSDCSNSGFAYAIPSTSGPEGVIAAFWDGLKDVPGKTRWAYRIDGIAPDRRMTFEWHKMDLSSSSVDGEEITFQVVLFENGLWEIWNAPRVPGTDTPNQTARWGAEASIGIESPDGLSGLQISFESVSGLCSEHTPGSGSGASGTAGTCTPITRHRPKLLPASGSTQLTFQPESYTKNTRSVYMRAYGPLGAVQSKTIVATINRKPELRAFKVDKAHVGAGEKVRFEWEVYVNSLAKDDFVRVEIRDADGALVPIPNPTTLTGVVDFVPTKTTTYTLVGINRAGYEALSTADHPDEDVRPRTVVVGPPTLTGAKVTPSSGAMNDPYVITWTDSQGISELKLIDPNGNVVFTAPGTDPDVGARTITPPNLTEPGVYTLVASNPSGDTRAELTIDIDTAVRIVSFKADTDEQTTGKLVKLTWEVYNGAALTISNGTQSHTTEQATTIRNGSHSFEMGSSDTTYVVEVSGPGGATDTASVVVRAAPTPEVTEFKTTPANPKWGQPFQLSWKTQNAASVQVQRLLTATGASGPEVLVVEDYAAARDQAQGSLTLVLEEPANFRIIAENRVGARDVEPLLVTPEVTSPTLTFEVAPATGMPKGGYADLTWTATQTKGVDLWRVEGTETNQIPYAYKPNEFIDIAQTGTELILKLDDTNKTANYRYGFSTVVFPDAFRPPYFGVPMAGMTVSGSGILTLSDDPNALAKNGCNARGTKAEENNCELSSVFSGNPAGPSASLPNAFLAPFSGTLSACPGKTSGTCTTRPLGKLVWQLLGTVPNRVLVVQWDNWDFSSTSYTGNLTFQVKVHENGDTEFQYKTLVSGGSSGTAQYAGGGYNGMGLESPDGLRGISFEDSNNPFLFSGDGWRFYTGRQARQGTLRSSFQVPSGAAPQIPFRATAENVAGKNSLRRSLSVLPGVNDLLLSELMVDPSESSDVGKEWIEIRNRTTAQVNLKGYSIQTASSFSTPHVFTEDLFVDGGKSIVVAQSANIPGVTVSAVYGEDVRMADVTDSVILRYGDVLVDRVEYDKTAGWRIPRGQSVMADPRANAEQNDLALMWCSGYEPNEANAVATPGKANPLCWNWVQGARDPSTDLEGRNNAADLRLFTGASTSSTYNKENLPIGFDFPYFGSRYATLNLSCYGFVSLGQFGSTKNSPSTRWPSDHYLGGIDMIAPLHISLYGNTAAQRPAGASAVYSVTEGEAPNRRFITHWAGYRMGSATATYKNVDFSLVLTEQGEIEFHYKLIETPGVSVATGVQAFFNNFALLAFAGTSDKTSTGAGSELSILPAAPASLKLVRRP